MSVRNEIHTDKILNELGTFGRFQIVNFLLILIPIAFNGIYVSQYVFNAGAVEYRCFIPECETTPTVYEASVWSDWSVWVYPKDHKQCHRMRPIGTTCDKQSFHENETVPCEKWIYKNYEDSIVSTFNLACQEWKRTLLGTVHTAGNLCVLPFVGHLSDRFGRRTVFILASVSAAAMGLIRSFSVSYIMYVVLEFIESFLGSGVYNAGYVLALEMVSVEQRVVGGNLISCTFATGQVILGLLAWAFPDWRMLTRILYVPSFAFIFYYFVIKESVRWLLSNGKKREAAKIIFSAAKINKRKLSPELVKYLKSEAPDSYETSSRETGKVIKENFEETFLWQVLKSRILISRLMTCFFWWITLTLVYYGLSINSVSLAGNRYVNYILASIVEIPGYCLSMFLLDRIGRKTTLMAAFLTCGISLLTLPFIPDSVHWITITLSLIGKLCISICFSSTYIYTSELFPTVMRQRFLSTCSMVGRIGSLVAPQTPLMNHIASLPYIIFGVMACCSGLLTLLTPETLHIRLPDTVKQAEDLAAEPRTRQKTDCLD